MYDGVVKKPTYSVVAFLQDLDIRIYLCVLEKPLRLVGRIFCLAIVLVVEGLSCIG